MSAFRLSALLLLSCLLAAPGVAITHKEGPTPDEERAEIGKMREETLNQLYAEDPEARAQVQGAKGYAVFSNFGMNIFLLSTANGGGVTRDNRNGADTYMKMFSAGAGIGLGVKKFRAVFIFHTDEALDYFITEGWDATGQADAAATTDADKEEELGAMDSAVSIADGVTVYQLTDKGLALQATLQGTKYWPDDDLN